MNFATLGNNPSLQSLSDAVTATGHRIVRSWQEDLAPSNSRSSESWEVMLTDSSIEAVIVVGDSDEIQTAVKQLASSGKPLLILPTLGFSDSCAYELSLIRDDSHSVLMPVFEHRFDTELKSLSQRLTAGELGCVRRLQIDVTSSDASKLLTEDDISHAMLADVDLLRWLGGNYDQVTSQRSGQSDLGCSQATLLLGGTNLPDATWNLRRGPLTEWRLTIESDQATTTITRSLRSDRAKDADSPLKTLIVTFVNAVESRSVPSPDWPDAVRVFDVLDAGRRSLRRRRTIDLHFETLSERQQFKTQMTAIGCGLLMLTLVLMLGLLGLGSLLDSRDRAIRDAEQSGLLFQASDFATQSTDLVPQAANRLDAVAARMKEEPKSVYVEAAIEVESSGLNQQRRQKIATDLQSRGVAAADHRTLLSTPSSPIWEGLMRVLRLAWLAPLILFLGLQILLVIAKPTANSTET